MNVDIPTQGQMVGADGQPLCFRHAVLFAINCNEDAAMKLLNEDQMPVCLACHREIDGHGECEYISGAFRRWGEGSFKDTKVICYG